ncbi:hypothetical protein [Acidomonas methanolica]|uniref:hypothetical protein n=3 Tax=Acidomonas methanolica TaxID=437 RepID=UPI001045817A|nr:hypothetical protein [Acidomonas methanolica]MBU2655274.1 hypothetical protein [Acidomonas methanolica]TCS24059.1 hypothetical protein EDC31_12616 [Acidomonas methanolica]GEL00116.1 hypothetical protein AME01nite_26140 [Acidomonas methanolica NBRC 104435]
MLAEDLTHSLLETLERPDLRCIAGPLSLTFDTSLPIPFLVRDTQVSLGPLAFARPDLAPTLLRHAIELARLRLDAPDIPPPLAGFAAARLAALFHRLDPRPDGTPAPAAPDLPWLTELAAAEPPPPAALASLWTALAPLARPCPTPPHEAETPLDAAALFHTLRPLWPFLGPTESLMAEGGDERLTVDPRTGLNRYGCSHRPRPWAITFASSTASSLSERGFEGAESARRHAAVALLRGQTPAAAQAAASFQARAALARFYGLAGADQVILAASGTDCELAALAVVASATSRPVTSLLIAPDETGSGVPLAAHGRHFSSETACNRPVPRGNLIEGFPEQTLLIGVPLRAPDGAPRSSAEVDAECTGLTEDAVAAGRHVLLHQLDLSKTGLLSPSHALIAALRARFPGRIDIVVDACQARIAAARVAAMVRDGAMVMVTGSKFFTGPPFCGALLLPETTARRLATAPLPAGLAEYTHAAEWPPTATPLPTGANFSLALRWHAALAEMTALAAVPPARIRAILSGFRDLALRAIAKHPDLTLLDTPPLLRAPLEGEEGGETSWDEIPTIFSFLVADPVRSGAFLALDDSRRLHRWLNADLSRLVPDDPLAARLCHLGQPVPVPSPAGGDILGALRLCAGARLVSGEPSHEGLDAAARLAREHEDARHALAKIGLILKNWTALLSADPVPHYAPLEPTPHTPGPQ